MSYASSGPLTPRMRRLLTLKLGGLTDTQAARELVVEVSTVRSELQAARRRTSSRSTLEACGKFARGEV